MPVDDAVGDARGGLKRRDRAFRTLPCWAPFTDSSQGLRAGRCLYLPSACINRNLFEGIGLPGS